MEEYPTRVIYSLEGMRPKEVSLCLKHIGR